LHLLHEAFILNDFPNTLKPTQQFQLFIGSFKELQNPSHPEGGLGMHPRLRIGDKEWLQVYYFLLF
jgi:hypothetical protein